MTYSKYWGKEKMPAKKTLPRKTVFKKNKTKQRKAKYGLFRQTKMKRFLSLKVPHTKGNSEAAFLNWGSVREQHLTEKVFSD